MDTMKPSDTRWEVNAKGDVICVFHGDQERRIVAVCSTDFPMRPWQVANLMNGAFESGMKAKVQQIRDELKI